MSIVALVSATIAHLPRYGAPSGACRLVQVLRPPGPLGVVKPRPPARRLREPAQLAGAHEGF